MCIRDVWRINGQPPTQRLARFTSMCWRRRIYRGERFPSAISSPQWRMDQAVSPHGACLIKRGAHIFQSSPPAAGMPVPPAGAGCFPPQKTMQNARRGMDARLFAADLSLCRPPVQKDRHTALNDTGIYAGKHWPGLPTILAPGEKRLRTRRAMAQAGVRNHEQGQVCKIPGPRPETLPRLTAMAQGGGWRKHEQGRVCKSPGPRPETLPCPTAMAQAGVRKHDLGRVCIFRSPRPEILARSKRMAQRRGDAHPGKSRFAPFLPPGQKRLRVQPPKAHAGINQHRLIFELFDSQVYRCKKSSQS